MIAVFIQLQSSVALFCSDLRRKNLQLATYLQKVSAFTFCLFCTL